MDTDVIVIGSGFGGSVCAARAAQAGMRVCVLERGRVMSDAVYGRMADGTLPLFHRHETNGLIDVQRAKGLITVGGSAVGGGSHVYTTVTMRPPCEVFTEAWPRALRHDELRPYFDRVEMELQPRPLQTPPPRTKRLHEIGRLIGAPVTTLPILMDRLPSGFSPKEPASRHSLRGGVVNLLRGGPGYRKRTLDQTYLAMATRHGAILQSEHEVVGVTSCDGGYRIRAECRVVGRRGFVEMSAPRVVIAAGTMNTLRLLLRCRDVHGTLPRISPRLGEGFYLNGDYGALLIGRKLGLADDGPPVTAWIDHWRNDRLYLMETGVLARGHVWSFGVMGYDVAPGRIVLGRGKRTAFLRIRGAGDGFHARRLARLRELAEATDARLLSPPMFVTHHWPTTIHPLGGAAMSDDASRGAADPFGEVWGCSGLYVADGSLLPTPTGVPPSMTIAALAERVAESLIRHA